MTLLSDNENFDRLAGNRVLAAIESKTENFTLMDACDKANVKYPITEQDLRDVVAILISWGIHWNTEEEVLRRLGGE